MNSDVSEVQIPVAVLIERLEFIGRCSNEGVLVRETCAAAAKLLSAQPAVLAVPGCATGVAKEIYDMGLKVGDTIIGRESGNGYNGYWHEAMLTLLWVGQSEAVWLERVRSDNSLEWSDPEEATDWALEYRDWKRCAAPAIHADHVPDVGKKMQDQRCQYCGGSGAIQTWATATSMDKCFKCDGTGIEKGAPCQTPT